MTTATTTSLKNKRAVVCGSTQGIGRACAESLAAAGASVVLIARHAEALEQVRGSLSTEHGQTHDTLIADFSDWEKLREIVTDYARNHPAQHILVNNTGGPPAGPVIDAKPEDHLKAFSQHLLCNQTLVQTFAPGMRDEKYGRIINIISTSVIAPIKGLGVSNTIRGAVANWGRTLAGELGPFNITVNNVLPGYTKTARLTSLLKGRAERSGSTLEEIESGLKETIPLRRMADASEIGSVVAFLASPAASYINGVNLPVDGGRTAVQ